MEEQEKRIMALFIFIIIGFLLNRLLIRRLPSNLKFIIWILLAGILIYFIYRSRKDHPFFRGNEGDIESMAILSKYVSSIGYIAGFFLLGLGAYALYLNKNENMDVFIGVTGLGLIAIITAYFLQRYFKKYSKTN